MMLALVTSCKNDKTKAAKTGEPVATKTETETKGKTYNLSSGTISWTASKITGKEHKGTLNISSGVFAAEGSKLQKGEFVIDMASLANTDMAGTDGQGKLEGHLKSPDFFDVEKFAKSTFGITSVADADTDEANCMITGNLTMMGVEKSITFPALVVAQADGTITAISDKFKINRTDWGVKYGSGLLGVAKDKAISDDVTLQIELKAK